MKAITNKKGQPVSFYHGTNEHFEDFEETSDIGFHFGTKKAALQRMKDIPRPEFEIEVVEPSAVDLESLSVDNADSELNNPFKRIQRARQQGFDTSRVVYHGSSRSGYVESTDIKEFDPSKTGDKWSADEKGFFFTTFHNFANDYALSDRDHREKGTGGGVVYPVYLKTEKPLIIDKEYLKSENMNPIGETEDTISFWDNYQYLILEWLEEGDYDSVILRDAFHKDQTGQPTETRIVFNPNQIRSIHSRFENEFSRTNKISEQDDPRYKLFNLRRVAYQTIYPRLHTLNPNIKNMISQMSEAEILSSIDEYKNKPISESFKKSVEKAKQGRYVSLTLNGKEIGRYNSKRDAISARSSARKGLMKEVHLKISNPIRLPDLGTWGVSSIAREIGASQIVHERLANADSKSQQMEILKEAIMEMGHDGIVYKNEKEDSGRDSYIVFNSNQILKAQEAEEEYQLAM